MLSLATSFAIVLGFAQATVASPDVEAVLRHSAARGRPLAGLHQAVQRQSQSLNALAQSDGAQQPFVADKVKSKYEAHCFPQRISHFDPSVNGTFCQRYWMDARSYKEGGPVYVLDGGETSGANRLQFLENGILQILSNATDGLSIVLEHRYYGDSIPVSSFSTDDLRWLNNAEALEDSAFFIENFKPPKSILPLSDSAVFHPSNTPWFYYGGSYAGARAAHMRVQYPQLVWGAIASSAVTHAQIFFPEYNDAIIKYAPEECINTLMSAVENIDKLLDLPEPVPTFVKGLFGLGELKDHADFGEIIASPLGYWQAKNWDPKVGSQGFYKFCDALTSGKAGSQIGLVRIPAEIVNYGNYIKEHVVPSCPPDESGHQDIEECFGSSDDGKFQNTDLSQDWRLWLFQVCTQWGYFQPAPLVGPSIISRHVTLDHSSKVCRQAYPPGKHFTVPFMPDVTEVNNRGDYGTEYSRLAFIDGDRDPWRYCTPQSDIAPHRNSTVDKPVHLIFDGVHHYDENGLTDHSQEPARIRDVHELEVNFISEWIAQFKEEKKKRLDA